MQKKEMKNKKRSNRPKAELISKICTKCSTFTGYFHNYMNKVTSAEMTTNICVYCKIIETNLVQRNLENLANKIKNKEC